MNGSLRAAIVVVGSLVGIAAAGLLATLPRYFGELRAAQKTLAGLGSELVVTQFGPTEYLRSGSGTPVLISHGVTGGVDQGLALARTYVGDGYDIIAVSRFGYLRTPMPADPRPSAQADAFASLLDHLGVRRVVVLGNSAGGPAALRFALQYPERCAGLILVSSQVPGAKAAPVPVMRVIFGSDYGYWLATALFGRAILTMFVPPGILNSLSKEERSRVGASVLKAGLPMSRRTRGVMNDILVSNPDIESSYALGDIRAPTLVIHAVDDPAPPFSGAQSIARQIPGASLLRFETGGHLLLGQELRTRQTVARFIDSASATGN